MIQIRSEKPLPAKCPTRYKGIAYDGCWFYLTMQGQCSVIRLDDCLRRTKCFETHRNYTFLCYDPKEKVFWAAASGSASVIYRLTEQFEETDCLSICNPDVQGKIITGISFDGCRDALVVSFGGAIVLVDPRCPQNATTFRKSRCERYLGVVALCPYILCQCQRSGTRVICAYDACGQNIGEMEVPGGVTFESAVFYPCESTGGECRFYVLASKQEGYPCILECVLCEEPLCDTICDCNYRICDRAACEESEPSCECHRAYCKMLESIALVEASIAHILNAEGEKLQKAIASTDDIGCLLEANASVRKTIEKATRLEQTLCDKLELLRDFDGDGCGDFGYGNSCCGCGDGDGLCPAFPPCGECDACDCRD